MRSDVVYCLGHRITIYMLDICTHIRVDSILYKINDIITHFSADTRHYRHINNAVERIRYLMTANQPGHITKPQLPIDPIRL